MINKLPLFFLITILFSCRKEETNTDYPIIDADKFNKDTVTNKVGCYYPIHKP